MRRSVIPVALGAVLALGSPALAHRGHSSLSVVLIEPDSGRVSVYHRMAAHDVEPALVAIAPSHQPSLDEPDTLKALEAYGARAFVLSTQARVWRATMWSWCTAPACARRRRR
jgi:hypothetical protein